MSTALQLSIDDTAPDRRIAASRIEIYPASISQPRQLEELPWRR